MICARPLSLLLLEFKMAPKSKTTASPKNGEVVDISVSDAGAESPADGEEEEEETRAPKKQTKTGPKSTKTEKRDKRRDGDGEAEAEDDGDKKSRKSKSKPAKKKKPAVVISEIHEDLARKINEAVYSVHDSFADSRGQGPESLGTLRKFGSVKVNEHKLRILYEPSMIRDKTRPPMVWYEILDLMRACGHKVLRFNATAEAGLRASCNNVMAVFNYTKNLTEPRTAEFKGSGALIWRHVIVLNHAAALGLIDKDKFVNGLLKDRKPIRSALSDVAQFVQKYWKASIAESELPEPPAGLVLSAQAEADAVESATFEDYAMECNAHQLTGMDRVDTKEPSEDEDEDEDDSDKKHSTKRDSKSTDASPSSPATEGKQSGGVIDIVSEEDEDSKPLATIKSKSSLAPALSKDEKQESKPSTASSSSSSSSSAAVASSSSEASSALAETVAPKNTKRQREEPTEGEPDAENDDADESARPAKIQKTEQAEEDVQSDSEGEDAQSGIGVDYD